MNIPETQLVDINKFVEDGHNPNVMTTEKFDALKKAIKKFGFLIPVICNKDFVIADGAHRLQAAKDLGFTQIPSIVLPVSDVDRRMLRQIMNKLSGEHDPLLDREEFKFLLDNSAFDETMELIAAKDKEIVQFMASITPVSEVDDVDVDDSNLYVKKGDIYIYWGIIELGVGIRQTRK